MLKRTALVTNKDLRLAFLGGQGFIQALLLGLLLIFLFSLAYMEGEAVPARAAAAIFWLASAFALVLIFNELFSIEEVNLARLGIITSPAPLLSVWLGKAVAGFVLLLISQCAFFPATLVFLGQEASGSLWLLLLSLGSADLGLIIVGALLGAISQGQGAKESLLSLIIFPLLVPVLLGAITLFGLFFSGQETGEVFSWIGLVIAFDALFCGAGLLLFPFVYDGEE